MVPGKCTAHSHEIQWSVDAIGGDDVIATVIKDRELLFLGILSDYCAVITKGKSCNL